MDLIQTIEKKFLKIEVALNSTTNSINNNYQTDFDYINNRILNQNQYEAGLNENRAELLKQLSAKKDENSIKSSISFARSLISIYESILHRIKFKTRFKFSQLVKYSSLMTNEKSLSFPPGSKLFEMSSDYSLHLLHFGLMLLSFNTYRDDYIDFNLVVIDQNGLIKHSKEIINTEINYAMFYQVDASATHIATYNNVKCLVKIYDFKLELVNSISLDEDLGSFSLNSYDILFHDLKNDFKVSFYSFKTANINKKEMRLDTNMDFGKYLHLMLLGFDEKCLFIGGCIETELFEEYALLVFSRSDGGVLFKSLGNHVAVSLLMYEREICVVKDADDGYEICFYDVEGSDHDEGGFVVSRFGDECVFTDIYSSANYKYVYSNSLDRDDDENLNKLKFRVY